MQSQACVDSHHESASGHAQCLITMGQVSLNKPSKSEHCLLSFFFIFVLNDGDHNS